LLGFNGCEARWPIVGAEHPGGIRNQIDGETAQFSDGGSVKGERCPGTVVKAAEIKVSG